MKIKWCKYIPYDPWPKQLAFLSLPHMEAFYGGQAGGGKSDALLMAALQYADIPGYKGIIFRRTYADMQLPSSILSRTKEWLAPYINSGEVKYKPGDNHTFYFPSGAQLACGYLQNIGDEQRYQGSEYSFVAFDEVTHFHEYQYAYLFSRLRNTSGVDIPIRMRSASNPSGVGLRWVKKRFQIRKDENGNWRGFNLEAPFIPASRYDNPAINAEEYGAALDKLGKVERERLKEGNWDINEDALFEKHWFDNRYIIKSNGFYNLISTQARKAYTLNDFYIFCTVDCAASVKTGVNQVSFIKNRPEASASVISTWGLTPDYHLVLLDNWRLHTTIPDLVNKIEHNHRLWRPLYTIIEKNGPGEGVYQMAVKKGLPVKPINTSVDKIKNSIAAQLRAEKGLIWLPQWANWLNEFEEEIFSWTGNPDEMDDQIDSLSNASNEAMNLAISSERDLNLRLGIGRALPYASGGLTGKSYFGPKRSRWSGGDSRRPLHQF